MGETAASNRALQVSVSFGRFEKDSLSWERWSAFSPNKYLEEVEKCATPGSVAQKKAYFEAHYKNIAARKAELLAQGKQMEKDPFRSPYQNGEDLSCNTCGADGDFDTSNSQGSFEGVKQETNSVGEIIRTHVDSLEDDVVVSRDYRSPSIEGENQEVETRSDIFQEDKPEEAAVVEQEESPDIEAEDVKEISHKVDNETGKASEVEAKYVKLDYPKFAQVTPVNKESNAAKLKQKSMPSSSKSPSSFKASQISTPGSSRPTSTPSQISTPRSSRPTSTPAQISTPRSSRPTSTPTKTPASASSTKRGSSPSFSGRKTTSTGQYRKVPNKSFHMSLSLGPSKPDPAPAPNTTMRKSFIMEKMGDKDIVKRAFKTFQNNFSQSKSFGEDKSLVKKQVPSRGTEPRVPTSAALRKENGRATQVDSMDKRSGNAFRTSLGLKSDISAEKGKESPRKIEEKSNAKEVERTRLQLKSKEEKLKRNVKATPQPSFYRGQKVSKSHQEKGM